jgi:hypothetical protein
MHSVYLEQIDIDDFANLSLNVGSNTFDDYLAYFLSYGCLADKVIMQGSAPLKSVVVQKIFFEIQEAFTRDEKHGTYNPIFSFSLGEGDGGYLEYNKERKSKLSGSKQNAELEAYKRSNSLEAASKIDKALKYVGFVRKEESAAKFFKKGVLIDVKNIKFKNKEKGDKFKEKAISTANDLDVFQSFNYMNALGLNSSKHSEFYKIIRRNYSSANAYVNNATTTFDSMHFNWVNMRRFISILGVSEYFKINKKNSTAALFHLRLSVSFHELKKMYFQCQSQQEIQILLKQVEQVKNHGKFKALLKESPASLISYLFTALNENDMGLKSVNKAGELLLKAVVNDYIDTNLVNGVYSLVTAIDSFSSELHVLNKKLRLV